MDFCNIHYCRNFTDFLEGYAIVSQMMPGVGVIRGCSRYDGKVALIILAVKSYLEAGNEGTVIYFGCPGEEGGSGKAFMASLTIMRATPISRFITGTHQRNT